MTDRTLTIEAYNNTHALILRDRGAFFVLFAAASSLSAADQWTACENVRSGIRLAVGRIAEPHEVEWSAAHRVRAQLNGATLLAISDTRVGAAGPVVTVVYEAEGHRFTTTFYVAESDACWGVTGCWMTEADALGLQAALPKGDYDGRGPAWVGDHRTAEEMHALRDACEARRDSR
jgi:hypothetical protein